MIYDNIIEHVHCNHRLEDLFKIRDLSLNPELVGYREYIYIERIQIFYTFNTEIFLSGLMMNQEVLMKTGKKKGFQWDKLELCMPS